MKIEIKNRFTGAVIFEHEEENMLSFQAHKSTIQKEEQKNSGVYKKLGS